MPTCTARVPDVAVYVGTVHTQPDTGMHQPHIHHSGPGINSVIHPMLHQKLIYKVPHPHGQEGQPTDPQGNETNQGSKYVATNDNHGCYSLSPTPWHHQNRQAGIVPTLTVTNILPLDVV